MSHDRRLARLGTLGKGTVARAPPPVAAGHQSRVCAVPPSRFELPTSPAYFRRGGAPSFEQAGAEPRLCVNRLQGRPSVMPQCSRGAPWGRELGVINGLGRLGSGGLAANQGQYPPAPLSTLPEAAVKATVSLESEFIRGMFVKKTIHFSRESSGRVMSLLRHQVADPVRVASLSVDVGLVKLRMGVRSPSPAQSLPLRTPEFKEVLPEL